MELENRNLPIVTRYTKPAPVAVKYAGDCEDCGTMMTTADEGECPACEAVQE